MFRAKSPIAGTCGARATVADFDAAAQHNSSSLSHRRVFARSRRIGSDPGRRFGPSPHQTRPLCSGSAATSAYFGARANNLQTAGTGSLGYNQHNEVKN